MKHAFDRRTDRGQSLVIVAVLMLAFFGILAVVLDGGFAYAMRRAAQNAADAGALAGARELCVSNGNHTTAASVAREYAVTRNGAVVANVAINSGIVTVDVALPFQTFLARLFGQPGMTAAAVAAAGCFAPGAGTGVLPIAWACRPPIAGSGSDDCAILYGPAHRYIIMDSDPTEDDLYCQDPPNSGLPAGTVDCDLDDDGFNDLLAGGDRSWLDLSGGGGGASDMRNWIRNGFPGTIEIHTWLGGQTGVANTVYQAAASRVGDEVVIPVFDTYCDGWPPSVCPARVHAEDTIVATGGTSTLYFHIISFSLFHITCVDAPGVPGHCPGHDAAVAAGAIRNNTKTIEGYFVEGFAPGLDGRPSDGTDAGAWTLYLTR